MSSKKKQAPSNHISAECFTFVVVSGEGGVEVGYANEDSSLSQKITDIAPVIAQLGGQDE